MAAIAVCSAASCGGPQNDQNSPKSAIDVIMSRKSVRSYTEEPVSDAQIQTILKAAMAAPSGMNVQPWRFVVVKDQAVKDALCKDSFNKMIGQAPVVIVVCGETTVLRRPRGAAEDAEPVAMDNGNWTADCAAATENLLLAVEALDLGAVWTACYPYEDRMKPTREALNLPEGITPYCIVPIGHPAAQEAPKDKWKEENIHYERW
ncbi:MAG: nitroreductase family protein [Bacteroidales bacterium]|nr:nitroreductase family protein [Bacteroidales bacterium]